MIRNGLGKRVAAAAVAAVLVAGGFAPAVVLAEEGAGSADVPAAQDGSADDSDSGKSETYPSPYEYEGTALKKYSISKDGNELTFPDEPALGTWYRVSCDLPEGAKVTSLMSGFEPVQMYIQPVELDPSDPFYSEADNPGYFWVRSVPDHGVKDGLFCVAFVEGLAEDAELEVFPVNNASFSSAKESDCSTATISKITGAVTLRIKTKVSMIRMYNPWSGEHLYTSDEKEIDYLEHLGWNNEGVAWTAPSASKTPVYRLYNPYTSDHHYTTDEAEYKKCGEAGWKQEGVAWYSDDNKGTPLYRGFNPYETVGTHHYTASKSEMETMKAAGWKEEGVGWYGLK